MGSPGLIPDLARSYISKPLFPRHEFIELTWFATLFCALPIKFDTTISGSKVCFRSGALALYLINDTAFVVNLPATQCLTQLAFTYAELPSR